MFTEVMAQDGSSWSIEFRGCTGPRDECQAARFQVASPGGSPSSVEVRVTVQIESILARHLGKHELSPTEREKILSVAGRQLIEESLARRGRVDAVLLLDSRLFLSHGAQRRLLRECGLLA